MSAKGPYRDEFDALRDRKNALEKELGEVEERLKFAPPPRRKLPMLDQIAVASPCSANWDDMVGDDRVRFCLQCDKNVFNLSAMSKADAEALLDERASGELCVRYYQRADGTIMTSDCPVGQKKKTRKKLALAVAAAGATAFAAVTALSRQTCGTATMGAVAYQGKMEMPEPMPTVPPVTTVQTPHVTPPVDTGRHVMGGIRATPPPDVVMGRRVMTK